MQNFKEFAALSEEKRRLTDDLDKVKSRMAELEPLILDEMAASGVNKITIDGVTVFIHRQLWAGIAEGCSRQDALNGLMDAGLEDFIEANFNTNRLSAYFRELDKDGKEYVIPAGINVAEKYSVRTRK